MLFKVSHQIQKSYMGIDLFSVLKFFLIFFLCIKYYHYYQNKKYEKLEILNI